MPQKKTLEDLLIEREKAEQNLKLQQEKLKQLKKKEASWSAMPGRTGSARMARCSNSTCPRTSTRTS